MSEQEQKKVFSKNLKYYLDRTGHSQKEVAEAIGVSPQTFNTWVRGIALPRMGKVEKLANYFGIGKSNLLDAQGETTEVPVYYLDPEAAAAAEFLHKNPRYKVLFDASRKVKPEDIDFVKNLIDRMTPEED